MCRIFYYNSVYNYTNKKMVLYCVVPECRNSSRTPGISLHRFPNDEIKKKAWCLRMRRHGTITSAMRVCSAHFLPEDYRYISDCRRLLKEGAEPSVFPYDTSQEAEAPLGFLMSMPKSKKVFERNFPLIHSLWKVPLLFVEWNRMFKIDNGLLGLNASYSRVNSESYKRMKVWISVNNTELHAPEVLSRRSEPCKEVQTWESQDTFIVPPLEDFLEVPLEYIRNKKMATKYFRVKEMTTGLFPLQIKKNVQESPNYNFFPKKEKSGTLHRAFSKAQSLYDPKIWKWLQRSKKTKKIFINYFASGMTPAAAIQHHESMLSFINPDFLNDSKRNPPMAWVYYLFDTWLKEKEGNTSKNGKKSIVNSIRPLPVEENVLVPSKNKDDPEIHQKDPQAPCIIHMNNELTEDYEDLKHLLIPNEVKELFYKYFDDGLDVSHAMKLNEENLKINENWPQFNPSKRLVNYIYKIWHEKTKSCDDWSRDSGFISFNENVEYKPSFEDLGEQTECQNTNNFTVTSQSTTSPRFKGSIAIMPKAEANNSPETAMEVLSFPFIPPSSSSNCLFLVENNDVVSKSDSPLQTEENFCSSNPFENFNVVSEAVKNLPSQTEEKLQTLNSLTFTENNNMVSEVVKDSCSQPDEKLCSSNTLVENYNVIAEVVNNLPSQTEEKLCSSNSCVFSENYNVKDFPSEVVKDSPSQTEKKLYSSSTHVENYNTVSEDVKSLPSQIEEKLCKKIPNIAKVDYIFDPVQSQFITESSQNCTVDLVNSLPVLMNSSSIKTDLDDNKISMVSVTTETKALNSLKNSPVSFYEEKSQELSYLNKPYYYSDFPNKNSFQTLPESSRHICQTTFSDSFNEPKISNHYGSPVMKDPSIFHSTTAYDSNICFEINSEYVKKEPQSFYPFVNNCSECVSRITSESKELSHIYSTTQSDSRINTFTSSSPTLISGYNIVKEIPNKSKMCDFMESEGSYYTPAYVNPINYSNNEVAMSFTDEEENEEFVGLGSTGNFKIVPLELSKQNEDQKFLMSLLPEFESIPDGYKVILKNDIINLVHSTKLRANKQKLEEL